MYTCNIYILHDETIIPYIYKDINIQLIQTHTHTHIYIYI